jgi:hypothetical protein
MTLLHDEHALAAITSAPFPAGAKRETLSADRPDTTLACVDAAGAVTARVSLWWREAPPAEGELPGMIGHFHAADFVSARLILQAACERLRAEGRTVAYGPMDGNTWRRYRFVVASDGSAPFFLEPTNPPSWPVWWAESGFAVSAGYSSSRIALPAPVDPRVAAVAARLVNSGVCLRTLDPARLEEELRAAYAVTVEAFSRAHLYTPLPETDFLSRYLSLEPALRPEFVLFAEKNGKLVGYLFATPNPGVTAGKRTLIGKTIAVPPGREFAGLGAVMSERLYAIAHTAGFHELIHALQFDGNASAKNLSGPGLSLIRRYALFSKRLDGKAGA